MHYGEISYEKEHVQSWDEIWRPSEKVVTDLRREWKSVPDAKVWFITNSAGGVNCNVVEVKSRKDGFWAWLLALFSLCLRWVEKLLNDGLWAWLCALFILFLRGCFEKIKECVITCLNCFGGMLVMFYDWLREMFQTR